MIITYIYPTLKKQKVNPIIEKSVQIEKKDSNIENDFFENLSYSGFDSNGNPYTIESKIAEIKKNEPNITYMSDVVTFFYYEDKVIKIVSEKAKYNKENGDMFFSINVKMTQGGNKIFSDNLDFLSEKNYLNAYNNVEYLNSFGEKGWADQVTVDLSNKTSKIFMFDENEKVKAKVNKK